MRQNGVSHVGTHGTKRIIYIYKFQDFNFKMCKITVTFLMDFKKHISTKKKAASNKISVSLYLLKSVYLEGKNWIFYKTIKLYIFPDLYIKLICSCVKSFYIRTNFSLSKTYMPGFSIKSSFLFSSLTFSMM